MLAQINNHSVAAGRQFTAGKGGGVGRGGTGKFSKSGIHVGRPMEYNLARQVGVSRGGYQGWSFAGGGSP